MTGALHMTRLTQAQLCKLRTDCFYSPNSLDESKSNHMSFCSEKDDILLIQTSLHRLFMS